MDEFTELKWKLKIKKNAMGILWGMGNSKWHMDWDQWTTGDDKGVDQSSFHWRAVVSDIIRIYYR